MTAKFTKNDLKDYSAYEKVRKGGGYNMFDPRARAATKLSPERYSFVMRNYSQLRIASEAST